MSFENFEIEFFPVGEGSRAGDAITVRYEVAPGDYRVMVIDGGTDDSGAAIVKHIREVYGEHTVVSDVVSTHPDTDHSCGLRAVLTELPVERLWVHGLWHHAADILPLFADSRWTPAGLEAKIKDEYPVIAELIDLAIEQGAEVYQPFAGNTIGPFTVLSPTVERYQHLIPQFRKTPDANVELLKQRGIWLNAPKGWLSIVLEKAAAVAEKWVKEDWNLELLREDGITAAENESSTVLLGNFGTSRILLTGDAGRNALTWACDAGQQWGLAMAPFNLIQVPHHGSRRNVSPSVLNRLVGPLLPLGYGETQKAIASVPKDDSKHPRKMVVNAFTRRGAGVRKTKGTKYRYHNGMPPRPGEVQAVPLGFFEEVEDYD